MHACMHGGDEAQELEEERRMHGEGTGLDSIIRRNGGIEFERVRRSI